MKCKSLLGFGHRLIILLSLYILGVKLFLKGMCVWVEYYLEWSVYTLIEVGMDMGISGYNWVETLWWRILADCLKGSGIIGNTSVNLIERI